MAEVLAVPDVDGEDSAMRTIALEEHFWIPELAAPPGTGPLARPDGATLDRRLRDLGRTGSPRWTRRASTCRSSRTSSRPPRRCAGGERADADAAEESQRCPRRRYRRPPGPAGRVRHAADRRPAASGGRTGARRRRPGVRRRHDPQHARHEQRVLGRRSLRAAAGGIRGARRPAVPAPGDRAAAGGRHLVRRPRPRRRRAAGDQRVGLARRGRAARAAADRRRDASSGTRGCG